VACERVKRTYMLTLQLLMSIDFIMEELLRSYFVEVNVQYSDGLKELPVSL